jgi:hypothetical protein
MSNERKPLLSDTEVITIYRDHCDVGGPGTTVEALYALRDFYESKIASGELIHIPPNILPELTRRYPELFKL